MRDEDLRLAFIKELLLLGDEAGIFAHEGRHAIDLITGKFHH